MTTWFCEMFAGGLPPKGASTAPTPGGNNGHKASTAAATVVAVLVGFAITSFPTFFWSFDVLWFSLLYFYIYFNFPIWSIVEQNDLCLVRITFVLCVGGFLFFPFPKKNKIIHCFFSCPPFSSLSFINCIILPQEKKNITVMFFFWTYAEMRKSGGNLTTAPPHLWCYIVQDLSWHEHNYKK